MTVTASIYMGFQAFPGDPYLSLSSTDQINFKEQFIIDMESTTDGIPASVRAPWESYSYPSSSSHIPESDIAAELDNKLKDAAIAPDVSFQVNSSGLTEVRYYYRGGKRYCHHIYKTQRELVEGEGFSDWKISRTYGSTTVDAVVYIQFSWPTTY